MKTALIVIFSPILLIVFTLLAGLSLVLAVSGDDRLANWISKRLDHYEIN